jgi:microcompartment protein CcmK/EutM
MKLGKVIGNVVASVKDPGLEGLRLLVIQGLNDNMQPIGNPYVAADGIFTAGPGDIVYIVSSKEAAFSISKEDLIPIDECIVGFVDSYEVVKEAKISQVRTKKPDTEITSKVPTSPKSEIVKKPSRIVSQPPKSKPKPSSVPKTKPKPSSVPKTKPKPSSVPKTKPKPSSVPEAQPEPSPIPEAQPEPSPISEAQPEPSPIPEARPEPNSSTKKQARPKPKSTRRRTT